MTNVATIVVPWDANGNDMPDDWEFLWFDGDMSQTRNGDKDGDGFPNYAEWVANTDPEAPGSYVGWENKIIISSNTVQVTFQSVAGRTYHIQGFDGVLTAPGVIWTNLATVVATTTNTAWTDTNALPNVRNYRIKIPYFQP